jgi:hypothetical protein
MGWVHVLVGAFGLLLLSPSVWMTLWTCGWEGIECDFTNEGQVWELFLRFLGNVVPYETMYLVLVSVTDERIGEGSKRSRLGASAAIFDCSAVLVRAYGLLQDAIRSRREVFHCLHERVLPQLVATHTITIDCVWSLSAVFVRSSQQQLEFQRRDNV